MQEPIDIIIPVFRGEAETRRCIESVLAARNDRPIEVVAIDDASPEPAISAWLRELSAAGRLTLVAHRENAGFVASVNQGMALHPSRDVILLNSDTEVADGWVDRLAAHANADAAIGTATPFSGNATICSYPVPLQANEIPPGETTATLDAAFAAANARQNVDIPTGVGFCLFISRGCLDAIGLFDVARYGTGYGEEVDFCMRAARAGFRNVAACDVYVRHVGEVSFGSTGSERRLQAQALIDSLYPEFQPRLREFLQADPLLPFRQRADLERMRASKRKSRLAILLIALVPVCLAAPQLAGWVQTDPLIVNASFAVGVKPGVLPGLPYIDPNAGFQTQALGYRSAAEWFSGRVPWWNSYSGIGLPLAAEYQPASFFPLTLLMLLPLGPILLHIILQAASGVGAFLLLRRICTGHLPALIGGLLFALNGTVVWFAHGPASVVPWLPWLLYGLERSRAASASGKGGGWRCVALAMALSLLAGFPEVAYINGLFALAWACVRGIGLTARQRMAFARKVGLGGALGVLLAMPQIVAFFLYMREANVGGHADMSHDGLPSMSAIGSLVAPYVYGPIFGYHSWPLLEWFWGSIGGYVTLAIVLVAAYGFWTRRDGIAWLLAGWIVLALGKTFVIEPAVTLWNLVPGISISAFARYAQASWELAFVILASFALERGISTRSNGARWFSALLALFALLYAADSLLGYSKELASTPELLNFATASMIWAALTSFLAIAWLPGKNPRGHLNRVGALLVCDAALMSFIPTLSAPTSAEIDRPALEFLQSNLGLQRFFTLGPMAPNYGAYFGLASINHNYLPVSSAWVDEIKTRFDPSHDNPVVFDGRRPSSSKAARERTGELERLGVRYVIAFAGTDPYAGHDAVRVAFSDTLLTIFELPAPAPYWTTVPAVCEVLQPAREQVDVNCARPALLVRRELAYPGWTASIGATPIPVNASDKFQAVSLPAGLSRVKFRFAPPYIGWAWAAMLLASAILILSAARSLTVRRD